MPTGETFIIQESEGNQQGTAVAYSTNGRAQLAWQDDSTGPWDLFTAVLDRSYQVTHIQYDYDPLYRLTSAMYSGDLSASYAYVYDTVSNMTAYVETVGTATSSVNRTFNDANQLVTSSDTELGTASFYYDDNGNLTMIIKPGDPQERLYYHYNQRNLLVLTEEQQGTGPTLPVAEFVYDGDANRLQQIDRTGSQPATTTYTNDILGLSQVLVSNDGATTTNLFGLDLISQDNGNETRTLLADCLGSTRIEMVVNVAGTAVIQTTTTYEPYGKLLAQTGIGGTTYGFTGEQYDALTYNPSLKLFMSRDPFPGYTTLPISQNGYAYVHANPVNLTDPSGKIIPLIIGGLVIGAVTGITWDVMINQGASVGGVSQIFNGILWNNLRCNVDLAEALFFGGVSAPIGAVAAPVIYVPVHVAGIAVTKVGGTIASWLCLRDGDCINGAQSAATTIQRTINFLANKTNTVDHVMLPKHAWGRLINLSGDSAQNYQAIQPYLQQTMDNGIRTLLQSGTNVTAVRYTYTVQDETIVVQGIELAIALQKKIFDLVAYSPVVHLKKKPKSLS